MIMYRSPNRGSSGTIQLQMIIWGVAHSSIQISGSKGPSSLILSHSLELPRLMELEVALHMAWKEPPSDHDSLHSYPLKSV